MFSAVPTISVDARPKSLTKYFRFPFKFPAAIKEAKINRSEILVEKEKKVPDYSNGDDGNLNNVKSDDMSDDNNVSVNVSSDNSNHTNITTIST